MKQTIQSLVLQAVDTVLPPRCAVTGDIVDRQGTLTPSAWASLDFIENPMCACCGYPFEFEAEPGALCAQCLHEPPPFETARSALKYNEASRNLILAFKHADETLLVRTFIPWIKSAGAQMLAEADILAPVPLHPWRLFKRRYNQSAILAIALSKKTDIAVLPEALERVRSTPSQGHLKANERIKNVKNAFAIHPKHAQKIQGKTLVLIDDVYTTGATAKECAKALLKGGAKAVHVLAIARVVKEGL